MNSKYQLLVINCFRSLKRNTELYYCIYNTFFLFQFVYDHVCFFNGFPIHEPFFRALNTLIFFPRYSNYFLYFATALREISTKYTSPILTSPYRDNVPTTCTVFNGIQNGFRFVTRNPPCTVVTCGRLPRLTRLPRVNRVHALVRRLHG